MLLYVAYEHDLAPVLVEIDLRHVHYQQVGHALYVDSVSCTVWPSWVGFSCDSVGNSHVRFVPLN